MPPTAATEQVFDKDYSRYGFHDKEEYVFKSQKGLSKEIVEQISKIKNEPEWMLKFRLKSLEEFYRRPMPQWGANLNIINFDDIYYYLRPTDKQSDSWDDVPEYIKNTFNKLGIPEAEQKFLGGVGAQYESEVVYHKIRDDLAKQGVVFLDMDGGLREYPEIVKKYFNTVIPYNDNKIAALNSAVWSGGSFVYIPAGVKVDLPLQAYFRFVGYYVAEGSIIGEHYLTFTFNKKERKYLDDVKDLLEKFFGKNPLEYKEYKNGISIVLCSTLAARFFKNEFGKGAKNKSLPKWFMLESPEKQAEFIKGYWRGDGSFMNKKYSWVNKRMFRINTISETLAEQTRDILLRMNVFASINVWKKLEPRNNSFAVYVGDRKSTRLNSSHSSI